MPSMAYRSAAENSRDLLPDVSGRKPLTIRSSLSNANFYWATVRRNFKQEWKIVEVGSCRQRKIWIAALKFDELCNRKFLFCEVGWLPSFRISPWLKLIHKATYYFTVDFAAVPTLFPAFHLAILVFPICHGINLFNWFNSIEQFNYLK